MEVISGKIIDITPQKLIIEAPYESLDRVLKRKYEEVEIGLKDGRTISPKQRKLIHSLIGSMAVWAGDLPEAMKKIMKIEFKINRYKGLEKKLISLSNCSMNDAYEFTKYLIEIVLEYDVPLNFSLLDFLKDNDEISHYIWACLKFKKCCICGKKAELHHVDRVGMGRNRDEILHEGMEALPLCGGVGGHHINYIHIIGDTEFFKREHIPKGIVLDKELCKIWKLKARKEDDIRTS